MAEKTVLVSEDKKFQCQGNHAVDVAYMLSCAEAECFKSPEDVTEIFMLVGEYLTGNLSPQEVRDRLFEE